MQKFKVSSMCLQLWNKNQLEVLRSDFFFIFGACSYLWYCHFWEIAINGENDLNDKPTIKWGCGFHITIGGVFNYFLKEIQNFLLNIKSAFYMSVFYIYIFWIYFLKYFILSRKFNILSTCIVAALFKSLCKQKLNDNDIQ